MADDLCIGDGIAANGWLQIALAAPFGFALAGYLACFVREAARGRFWSSLRLASFLSGCALALLAVAGPLAARAHYIFADHMLAHLLLAMLAPLLIALGAPVTLLLRALPVDAARRVTRVLQSAYMRFVGNPLTAAALNTGGLWLLYQTDLFSFMHRSALLYWAVHMHLFLAGWLFTISIAPIDPAPHRASYPLRAFLLVASLAAHGILSKLLFVFPPAGVSAADAQEGAWRMYYGGDAVDAGLILLFCAQWYKETRPVRALSAAEHR